MKYIIYKNDIYEVIEEEKNYVVCVGRLFPTYKCDIKKQADTIYELCDYAVVKSRFTNLPDVMNLEEMNKKGKLHNPPAKYIDNLKFLMTDKRAEYIKFAILTDKGLIYVAKMNEKGELELL